MSDDLFKTEEIWQLFQPYEEDLLDKNKLSKLIESDVLESGDVLIFSGISVFSDTVRFFQPPVPFTHVGVVVRDLKLTGCDGHYLYQSNNGKHPPDISPRFVNYNSTGGNDRPPLHDGVKLSMMCDALKNYHGYAIVLRRLQWAGREDPVKRLEHRQWFWDHFLVFMALHFQKRYERKSHCYI